MYNPMIAFRNFDISLACGFCAEDLIAVVIFTTLSIYRSTKVYLSLTVSPTSLSLHSDPGKQRMGPFTTNVAGIDRRTKTSIIHSIINFFLFQWLAAVSMKTGDSKLALF